MATNPVVNFLWALLGAILSCRPITDCIIRRATRTPYKHLDGYMNRYWLFNAYEHADGTYVKQGWLRRLLPSIRVHHILRQDLDIHMHDHPWDARTIILRGLYIEEHLDKHGNEITSARMTGDTRAIRFGEYHRISFVPSRGVFTLFFTWKYVGTWGFLVSGKKIPWREYLGIDS